MDALGLWMDGYAGSIFHWAGILPTFLHIFLATINAMALIFKQFVILSADLHTYHAVVLEELVIVLYKTFLVVFTLLVTVLTPYHPRTRRKMISLISICLNLESKENRHLVYW
jgi:hypothetical protein